MAIDQKDLSAIANALATLLAPQVREVAAELVAVRVEAATQSMREGHEATLAQLKELSKLVETERIAREAAIAKAADELSGTLGTFRAYFNELLEATRSTLDKQLKEVSDKLPQLAGEFEATKEDFKETTERVDVRLAAHAQGLRDELLPAAREAATTAAVAESKASAVEITNATGVAVKLQLDEIRKETRATIGEALSTLPTLVEGQADNLIALLLPKTCEAAQAAAKTFVDASKDEVLALGRSASQSTIEGLLPALAAKVHDSIVEKTINEVLAQGEDVGRRSADAFLAGALPHLEELAGASGTKAGAEAGADAGVKAAMSMVPAAREAAHAIVSEALPGITEKTLDLVQSTAKDYLEGSEEVLRQHATEAGREAGAAAAVKSIPELQSAALGILAEAEPTLMGKAKAQGAVGAGDFWAANNDSFLESARAAGSEAGMAAAVRATPDAVNSVMSTVLEQACAAAAATAEEETAKTVNRRWDEIKEAATTVAVAKSLQATGEAVPGLVAGQAGAVGALVLPGATQAAIAAAKALGEQAIATAREHAGTAATAAAADAIGALREQLAIDLDPTERVDRAVEDKIGVVSKELGDAIADAVDTHVKEELPKMQVYLTAKVQAELDRWPRPKDGEHGKDARVETPYPYVEGKMYEQGSWVNHENTVWVAARHTDLVPSADNRDWYCVVPGIKNITATLQPDLRTLSIVTELGGGTLFTNSVKLDIPITKGVYKPDFEFSKRDIATYDGSWWEALKDGLLPLPGTAEGASAWKMHIKRGANAPAPKAAPTARPVFRGDWVLDELYQAGEQTDHAGYRWMALKSTRERPPFSLLKSNDIWTMMGPAV